MKKIGTYLFVFSIGILFSLYYFKNNKTKYKKEQIKVVLNEIKNVSKLVVSEATFSEMYSYENAEKYLFETFSFDKKVILSVNAKVQVSFDLSKMEIVTDTINKKIIIKSIPEQEIFISPEVSYFDFEQSSFNPFTKEELNQVNEKSIEEIKKTIAVSELQQEADKRLIEELNRIYVITKLLNWEVIDETENQLFFDTFKD